MDLGERVSGHSAKSDTLEFVFLIYRVHVHILDIVRLIVVSPIDVDVVVGGLFYLHFVGFSELAAFDEFGGEVGHHVAALLVLDDFGPEVDACERRLLVLFLEFSKSIFEDFNLMCHDEVFLVFKD